MFCVFLPPFDRIPGKQTVNGNQAIADHLKYNPAFLVCDKTHRLQVQVPYKFIAQACALI
jgi:hypothetical protein